MRISAFNVWLPLVLTVGCGSQTLPIAPSPASSARTISLEAEAGSGEGDLVHRSHASGGFTIHLAPGQRRLWTFVVGAHPAEYVLSVTYSNDNPGDTEILRVELDGQTVGSFRAQDTGDDGEGWNIFVADRAGASMLRAGTHTLLVESTGGDGCVEIDLVSLSPGNS
jgi:hypothetical protein